MNRYKVLKDRILNGELYASQGDIVYDCMNVDFGCANDDTRFFKKEHISVTKKSNGDYPFFHYS